MKNYLFIKGKERGDFVKIKYSQILFFKQNEDYCEIHTDEKRHLMYTSMISLEEQLPEDLFHRCNRGCIVNVDRIASIKQDIIHLDTTKEDSTIAIGFNYKNELLKKINFITKK